MRTGNNPKRRIVAAGEVPAVALAQLAAKAVYVGSGHHKRYPADYGFDRVNPVPTKSICDLVTPVLLTQAKVWFRDGIMKGMISVPVADGYPKYVWCVADDGRVFEAKTDLHTPGRYHGYPLEGEDDMKEYVSQIWATR